MLRGYVRLYRGFRLSQCQVRHISIEAHAAEPRRSKGRPKADDEVTKKEAQGRKHHLRADSNGSHELVPEIDGASRADTGQPSPPERKMRKAMSVYAPLLASSVKHWDLASFLRHAAKAGLNRNSTTYKGTFYEHMVVDVLKHFNTSLIRIGKRNDLGVDVIGHMELPGHTKTLPNEIGIIGQCKACNPSPKMIRELEGATPPAGWRGDEVFRLLVAMEKSTKGVESALQRSRYPMGFMQMTWEGLVKQFTWNQAAERAGLAGMGTTVKYVDSGTSQSEAAPANRKAGSDRGDGAEETIALTWNGRVWRPKPKKGSSKTEKSTETLSTDEN